MISAAERGPKDIVERKEEEDGGKTRRGRCRKCERGDRKKSKKLG